MNKQVAARGSKILCEWTIPERESLPDIPEQEPSGPANRPPGQSPETAARNRAHRSRRTAHIPRSTARCPAPSAQKLGCNSYKCFLVGKLRHSTPRGNIQDGNGDCACSGLLLRWLLWTWRRLGQNELIEHRRLGRISPGDIGDATED